MAFKRIAPYLIGILWLSIWWLPPFFQPQKRSPQIEVCPYDVSEREQLRRALGGDLASMEALLLRWQQEKDYVLLQKNLTLLHSLTSHKQSAFYLPQTFPSACSLLAILPHENILCIPKGLQEDQKLFNFSTPFKTLPYPYSEYLWKTKPKLVFISTYSNPTFISTLQAIKIPYLRLDNAHSLGQMQKTLKLTGKKIGRKQYAKLLVKFVKAALKVIDFRMNLVCTSKKTALKNLKPVFLFHHLHFSSPSPKTLSGELLSRIGFANENLNDSKITLERLKFIKPKLLILASENYAKLEQVIQSIDFFKHLKTKFYFVDATIQHSPTQFAVLAYYDLASCIIHYLRNTDDADFH